MTTTTLPRALLEQALEALERARPLKADYTTLEYFEEAKRKHYAAMAALRAALAQQAEPTPPDATAGLVDDLCLLHMGWGDDENGALERIVARARAVRKMRGNT